MHGIGVNLRGVEVGLALAGQKTVGLLMQYNWFTTVPEVTVNQLFRMPFDRIGLGRMHRFGGTVANRKAHDHTKKA